MFITFPAYSLKIIVCYRGGGEAEAGQLEHKPHHEASGPLQGVQENLQGLSCFINVTTIPSIHQSINLINIFHFPLFLSFNLFIC